MVTLTGHVDTYSQKLAAARTALKPRGMKAVAEEIKVAFSGVTRSLLQQGNRCALLSH